MIYLIYNEYFNRQVKTIELRNEYHEQLSFKLDEDLYQIGDYVFVEKINGKQKISHKVNVPENFLKYYNHGSDDIESLKEETNQYIAKIKSEAIKAILNETILNDENFYLYPAAKSIHHAFIGGLARHSLNMLRLAENFIQMYNLDYDLVIAGCLLHDYGKVFELTDYGLNYSLKGNLLGHISICYELVSNIAINYGINDDNKVTALKHIILAHHGKMEYGSPKEPMTLESYVVTQLDEIDAKMDLLTGVLQNTKPNKLSAPILAMDRRRFIKLSEE